MHAFVDGAVPNIPNEKPKRYKSVKNHDELKQEKPKLKTWIKQNIMIDKENNITKTYVMQDKVWGLISLPYDVQAIITHPIYRRLKKIKQLGIISYFKPLADHTRYSHSVGGVAHLVYTVMMHLHEVNPKEIPMNHVLCTVYAGLCHDLGHGPYSHNFDSLLAQLKIDIPESHHEYRSMKLVKIMFKELNEKKLLSYPLSDQEISFIQYLIDPEKYKKYIDKDMKNLPMFKAGIDQIVNNYLNKMDVDKMDYLIRDSLHLGIETINAQSIIQMLKRTLIINDKWVFDISDRRTIELLLHHRYVLYTQYYCGNKSLALSYMVSDILSAWINVVDFTNCIKLESDEDIDLFCSLTDLYIFQHILNSHDPCLNSAKKLIHNIIKQENCYTVGDDQIQIKTVEEDTLNTNKKLIYAPIYLFSDKSNPFYALNLMIYHNDGQIIEHDKAFIVREVNTKNKSKI